MVLPEQDIGVPLWNAWTVARGHPAPGLCLCTQLDQSERPPPPRALCEPQRHPAPRFLSTSVVYFYHGICGMLTTPSPYRHTTHTTHLLITPHTAYTTHPSHSTHTHSIQVPRPRPRGSGLRASQPLSISDDMCTLCVRCEAVTHLATARCKQDCCTHT